MGRGQSGGFVISLCLAGDELWNVVVHGFRFSKAGYDGFLFFVQRPERIAEQVLRVVFSFDLNESVPVLPETRFNLVCTIAATEELEGAVRNHSRDAGQRTRYIHLGMDPLASQALTFHLTTINDLR